MRHMPFNLPMKNEAKGARHDMANPRLVVQKPGILAHLLAPASALWALASKTVAFPMAPMTPKPI
jgi:hypothetical protein